MVQEIKLASEDHPPVPSQQVSSQFAFSFSLRKWEERENKHKQKRVPYVYRRKEKKIKNGKRAHYSSADLPKVFGVVQIFASTTKQKQAYMKSNKTKVTE